MNFGINYDRMQSMVELYLLEAERDGIEPCGIPVGEARELLLDFAQWFCDDVQDELKADLTAEDITMQNDGTMIFASDEGIKPGEIAVIQSPLQPVGKSNFAAYLEALAKNTELKDIKLRFGECKDEEESQDE